MFSGGNFSIVPEDLFAFFVKHGDVSAKMSYSGGPFHNFWKVRGLFCECVLLGKTVSQFLEIRGLV